MKYQSLLAYIALREDSISVDENDPNDPNDTTTVESHPHLFIDDNEPNDKAAIKIKSPLVSVDNPFAVPPTESDCQCRLFCDNCIPQHLLLKGCWYEERTPAEQQQEISRELEPRRQQGIDELEAGPYHPVVMIRHHPNGRKLVFTTRGTHFSPTTYLLMLNFMTVAQSL
jgi:hypothetical protein